MRASSLAWVGWMVTISLVADALILGLANRQVAPLYEVTSVVISPTFATLGTLIVSRRPGSVTGWIFLASGLLGGVLMFFGQYATVALALHGPVSAAGQLGVMACVVAALLSMVVRFYRSRGEERLQLKWFTYAAMVGVTTPLLLSVLAPAAFEVLGRLVWTLGFLSIPVSAAVAILKYRLYDIDRIINRTLVYAVLTAA